ncbi:hypothetical protein [Aeromonas phage 1233]|nr:hypothetical protein [Aeromonas phage 1233]
MKRIGKGEFTTAYLLDSGKVLLESRDAIKECMANEWFPSCRLFPKVEYAPSGLRPERDGYQHYLMDYYPNTRSLKGALEPRQWALYQALRDCWNNTFFGFGKHPLDWMREFLDRFRKEYPQFRRQHKQLFEAWEATRNYSELVLFEISPRNVRAHNGKLILMDCFFIRERR